MKAYLVTVPATPTSLAELLDTQPRHTQAVGLQAPAANTSTIYVGDYKIQPAELRPEANGYFPEPNFREIYVMGSPPDQLTIVLFDNA